MGHRHPAGGRPTPRTKRPAATPDAIWATPDGLWPALESIPAEFHPSAPTGRPRADFRRVVDGVICRMRSGVQGNKLPAGSGSDSTAHRWFQRLVADGVFERPWAVLGDACDASGGAARDWQSADAVVSDARSGGASSARTRRTGASRAPTVAG